MPHGKMIVRYFVLALLVAVFATAPAFSGSVGLASVSENNCFAANRGKDAATRSRNV